jgi:hypothetical protein
MPPGPGAYKRGPPALIAQEVARGGVLFAGRARAGAAASVTGSAGPGWRGSEGSVGWRGGSRPQCGSVGAGGISHLRPAGRGSGMRGQPGILVEPCGGA